MKPIILASTSPYRRELLERLRLPFEVVAPGFDEEPRSGESGEARARRFAAGKAAAVARALGEKEHDALVIGSDQVVLLGEEILGKPLTHERAAEQLAACSGRRVRFLTAVTVLAAASGESDSAVVSCDVHFRPLSTAEIESYLRADEPYDCAGSIRAERLGIALFDRVEGQDPTALIGLPLIALAELLRAHGVDPVTASSQ